MYHVSGFSGQKTARYSGLRNSAIRIRYPGDSGKYRAGVRAHLNGLGCPCARSGLGDTAQAKGAVATASTGAKAGSMIWPGVGTVIGFAVGAIYGYLKGKKKPTRPSKQDIASCKQVIRDYEALIAPYPTQPIGRELGEPAIKAIWMCLEMVVAGTTPNPLWLEGNWLLARDMAIEAVKKTFTTPAGSEIVLSTAGRKDRNGKAFRLAEVRWQNGEANTMNAIAEKLREFFLKGCLTYHKPAKCEVGNTATWRHSVMDLVDWAAATQIPQVEVSKDPDAVLPGTQQPLTATVSVPSPILTATVPIPYPVVPAVAISSVPGAVAPVPAQAGAPPGAYEAQLAAQLQPMIQTLLSQGADQKYAFTAALSSLAQRGIEPTAAVQTAVAEQVRGASAINPWIIVGGGVAVAVAMFAISKRR